MLTATKSRISLPAALRIGALSLATALMLSGCSQPPKIEKVEGYAQGTTYHISFWSDSSVPVSDVKTSFNNTLAQIDKELSTWRNDSYISEFNHSSSTAWQAASDDFIALIHIAKDINQKSGGCYDPTIGPLFDLWGFKKESLHVPSQQELAAAKADLGMDKLEVDDTGKRIRKTIPALQIDFSSMGEGYTISKLSQVLEAKGVNNYLVEFGGDMKIKGHKPNGDKWRVAVERPVSDNGNPTPYQIVTINDESGVSLDTSGTYHHYFDDNGKEYSHILNPNTGQPVIHDLVSASVFGTDPRVSDAWATTMLCLGQKEGAKIAQQENLEVFFIENKQGKLVNSTSQTLADSSRVTFESDKK